MSFFSALRSSEYTRYAVVPQRRKITSICKRLNTQTSAEIFPFLVLGVYSIRRRPAKTKNTFRFPPSHRNGIRILEGMGLRSILDTPSSCKNEKYLPFSTVSSKRDSKLGRLWVRGDFIRRGSVSLCNHLLLFSPLLVQYTCSIHIFCHNIQYLCFLPCVLIQHHCFITGTV